jgi:hypothetical protein
MVARIIDETTVRSFGEEWSVYDQSLRSGDERTARRTNAFDRFATPLEQRFSRALIETMMRKAGLDEIRFSEGPPLWCAVSRPRISPCPSTKYYSTQPAITGTLILILRTLLFCTRRCRGKVFIYN